MNRAQGMTYPWTEILDELVATVWGRIRRAVNTYAEARGRALAVRDLERLSDRTLSDIGLHRGQIRDAVYGESR